MKTIVQPNRLAIGALAVGGIAGLVAFGSLPVFEGYVAGVLGGLSGLTSLEPQAPGVLLAVVVALLVGVSMNFLPCNIPS